MSNMINHPFHLVNYSPWPLTGAFGTMTMMMGMIQWFNTSKTNMLMILGFTILTLTMFQWWRDITRESTHQGMHTIKVNINMRWGMILFIVSEIFFFFSFFWSFFHSSLSTNIELGMIWPPKNILVFNPFQIPLLNTLILLISGISVTWTHHSMLENNFNNTFKSLLFTILLGIYFTGLQAIEYVEASFSMADSIFGSTFFMATGFHGFHVFIGTTFLLVNLIRIKFNHFSKNHHFGFEAAAWYWHFVDVVWIFLFTFMYWWNK
uniref:cytochrome c oxidase subunit III n=1 Tax=Arctopsyche spinescens TaxID=2973067 RepID=UPI00223765E0|nr:cytochrome c oxidase subunit III [Arctopsyche spinescens]UYO79362.1 cytochrome c oxidase subunit III [Arctopsyche spinescens]